jgi:chromosome partitioning protein
MSYIIAIANQKGGVGKTTTAVNLSAALANLGKKTLLVDLDPQGNATTAGGLDKNNLTNSICEVLLNECETNSAIYQVNKSLDIIGTNTSLVASEVELLNTKNSLKLKTILDPLNTYEYIIIDCPPSLNMLTVNALSAADGIIIPMQCEYYSLEGLSSLLQTIERIKQTNSNLEIIGVLRTMFDGRSNLSNEVSIQLISHFKDKVFKTIIPRNVALAEAPSFGTNILEYNKTAKGAIAYMALASELTHRIKA